jgi:putative membrane protein
MPTTLRTLGFAALALGLAACGTPRMGTAPAAPELMAATAVTEDDDILHVFITSNNGEVMTSQPFVEDFQSNEVRDFAMMMVRDHTAANERAEALPIEPDDNAVSRRMSAMATAKVAELEDMDGMELDRAYMDTQIQLHTMTLDMLDRVLIPNATDPALRALLQSARPTVATHLQEAQRIHRGLM